MKPGFLASSDQLLRELTEERAAALLRISRTLESLVDQLYAIREALARMPDEGRVAASKHYRDVRAQALKYRWYLEVQREALGLRHHQRLDEFYPIPPAQPEA